MTAAPPALPRTAHNQTLERKPRFYLPATCKGGNKSGSNLTLGTPPDSRDDRIWVSGPDEGLWVLVGLGEEALDGGLEIDERSEHTALEPASAELGKEALDGIEPGGRGWRVMEHKAGMSIEPDPHPGVLVAAVVVEDHVDDLASRDLGLDRIEKADEFLMPVALHAAADDLAVEHVEGGEQSGGAVALVVMGHRPAPAGFQRQPGLGAVERLDLRFLVDRQHHRVRRRIDVEPDDVIELGGELRIARQLELPHPMRLEPVRPPDPLHRGDAETDRLGHHRGRPMDGLARRIGQCQGHRALAHRGRQRWDARRPGLVAKQPIDTLGAEPLTPPVDRVPALAALPDDRACPQTFRRQQHDPRPPDMLLWAVAIRHNCFQAAAIAGTQHYPLAHSRPPPYPVVG